MKQISTFNDGVNLDEGDNFSDYCGNICRATYDCSHFVEVVDMSDGHFRGPRGWKLKNLPYGYVATCAPDGIGTKVMKVVTVRQHGKASQDLLAMTGMDITRWGGLPLIFTNVLDVSSLGERGSETNIMAIEMMQGLRDLAIEQGIVVLNGETAELGPFVESEDKEAPFKFNWAGVMFGVYHPQKMITGTTLRPGQIIMALKEYGFRSNGFSAVRKGFATKFGTFWWKHPGAEEYIRSAATPSVLYDRFLTSLNGWGSDYSERIPIHLITHLTGGGIKSKFAEDIIFRCGLSAEFDNLYDPPEIMHTMKDWCDLSDEDCYNKWNGGQGALVVIDSDYEERFKQIAQKYNIETQRCGTILATPQLSTPTVTIRSKFSSRRFSYRLKK